MLGEVWQWIAKMNPILYMVNAFRYGFLGYSDVNIAVALAVIIGFNLILFGVVYSLLERGVGIRT